MYYAEIKEHDIANGPGIRLAFFVSGCTHHCKGCFNEMTWNFHYGKPYTQETEDYIMDLLSDPSYQGMTLLGGEPMEPVNQKALLPLVRRFRDTYPEKDLWLFTGYLFDEDLLGRMYEKVPETKEILRRVDVIVDGEFRQELKDITLLYKGSSNQRTIDVQKSLAEHRVVQWDRGDVSMSKTSHL
ncbi:MAG: anaerobic ribonucleoside-triphosphate reductase activating protein [Bilifractor sp.]|jgi:anaerobic ribonucleoside-triphosphate reductase activating protein